MAKNIQAVRGCNDILPEQSYRWSKIENLLRNIARAYGYNEIRMPIIEFTELFKRSIGEATDIVEKEMYTFVDRNNDSLTLRPEGTASCVRAGIEHGLLYNQIQRLFYCGPMFRHERPQKGRYRQFHQFGIEVFGLPGPDIDAEVLLLSANFWRELNILSKVELQINTLGTAAVRAKYREVLVEYFQANADQLDADSLRRLAINPLRILDSKNPQLQPLISNAPKILDCLDNESKMHFAKLGNILDTLGVQYKINPCLVRGLDYYCLTVFEWVTQELGAQGAICAGGHYDNLVAQFGGKPTPAVGFAIGLERLLELTTNTFVVTPEPLLYFVVLGDVATVAGMKIAETIRANTKLRVQVNCGGGNLGTQLKRADNSLAVAALILGEAELADEMIVLKYLREERPQQKIKLDELINFLTVL